MSLVWGETIMILQELVIQKFVSPPYCLKDLLFLCTISVMKVLFCGNDFVKSPDFYFCDNPWLIRLLGGEKHIRKNFSRAQMVELI